MTIEDTVRASLAERLDSLDVPPGDLAAALREGNSARRRRPIVTGLVAVACLAAVAATSAVIATRDDSRRPEPAPAPGSGDWTRLPAMPLSPRANALTVWTGDKVLVIGGNVDNLCPPNADCVSAGTVARDGAAYDPDARAWTSIAAPPVDLLDASPHAIVGDVLLVASYRESTPDGAVGWDFHTYDVSDDRWGRAPEPAGTRVGFSGSPSVLDGRLYAPGNDGHVLVLDPEASRWTSLPMSPHQPTIGMDHVLATPEGVVALGLDSTQPNDGIKPSLLLAEIWDGTSWRRLGPSEILGGWGPWHWTGERLVAPYGECMDGGETNNYGRCIPTGGALDPATGKWAPLDQAPATQDGWNLNAAEGPLVVTWGQLYDDRDATWTPVPRPSGAGEEGAGAVFADGTLYAFGGVTWSRDMKAELSGDAWAWTP